MTGRDPRTQVTPDFPRCSWCNMEVPPIRRTNEWHVFCSDECREAHQTQSRGYRVTTSEETLRSGRVRREEGN